MTLKAFTINNNKIVKDGGSKINKMFKNLSKFKNLKNKKSKNLIYIKAIKKPIFLTFITRKALNFLKKAFINALFL